MQSEYRAAGQRVDYVPSGDVAVGAVVVESNLLGMATRPIAANAQGSLAVSGVFDIVKANEQITQGSLVYWDADGDPYNGTAGTGAATTTSTDNTLIGVALATAGATDEKVSVLKYGPVAITNSVHETLSAVITDPGNGGAIPITNSGTCSLVTTGAQTRTLAAPTFVGQMISLAMKTDGGDCVVTCATGINQTGNTTITLNDAGDVVVLAAIEVGANKRWRVVVNDGCTLGGP